MPTQKKTTKKSSKKPVRRTQRASAYPYAQAVQELGESIHILADEAVRNKGWGGAPKHDARLAEAYAILLDAKARLESAIYG